MPNTRILQKHFNRSREVFYYAESLRNFPRDSVDPGAFDEIREEIYHGVVNTYEMDYSNGYTRMASTLHAGRQHNAKLQCALHPRADAG